MSRRDPQASPVWMARHLLLALMLSLTAPLSPILHGPVLADSGAYVTAGSGDPLSIRAGIVLDLAGERHGADRRLDAQMHVLAQTWPSGGRDILLLGVGYGAECKLGRDALRRRGAVGAALSASTTIRRLSDRRTGEMGSGFRMHLDAYGLVPIGSRLHGVLGIERWLVSESRTAARIGIRIAFHSPERNGRPRAQTGGPVAPPQRPQVRSRSVLSLTPEFRLLAT